jgi:hypothetical protein
MKKSIVPLAALRTPRRSGMAVAIRLANDEQICAHWTCNHWQPLSFSLKKMPAFSNIVFDLATERSYPR